MAKRFVVPPGLDGPDTSCGPNVTGFRWIVMIEPETVMVW